MKNKSIILEILLIILPLAGAGLIVKIQLETNKPTESMLSLFCMFFPAAISYWRIKSKIKESNHPNPEKPIRIWQYLILGFYISAIAFMILITQKIIERSIKDIAILWLIWMIIYGNFSFKIQPFYEEPIHFFVADEDIQKRIRRLSGKIMVFGGIVSVFLLLLLPENLVGYVLLAYIFSFFIVPSFYGKILQWKKVA